MKNKIKNCPICRIPLDDNHYAPVSFPIIEVEICCNCYKNLSLMFTNFEEEPGTDGHGYIMPDYSDRLREVTGRSYQENRLVYYEYCLERESRRKKRDGENASGKLKAEIEKIRAKLEKSES
jgi:hypothetical protein